MPTLFNVLIVSAMQSVRAARPIFFGILGLSIHCAAQAQISTQNITLRPGWNAIHIEVEPTAGEPAQVFGAVGVESVWTFSSRLSAVDFIQDPNEPLWNRSSWRAWVPTNHPGAFQNSLFKILGNRPYLVNLTNTTPVTLSVSGRPSFRPLEWVPDSYNLRGFPIDPAVQPSFATFFRSSPAHFNASSAQLNKIYRLSTKGQWTLVSGTDPMEPGVAYWVFTRGASDFQAPLGLKVDFGDGLNFAATLSEQTISFFNATTESKNAIVTDLLTPGSAPLSYPNPDPVAADRWLDFPSPFALAIPPSGRVGHRLAIRRSDMTGPTFGTVLEVKDGQGTRWRIPVSAQKTITPVPVGTPPAPAVVEARNRAGLWVGNVTLNAVSEVNAGTLVTNAAKQVTRLNTSTNTTPTRAELTMRLLVHVDTNGNARLLRDVIQMWQNGTYSNDASGRRAVDVPGRFVLLTDDALIPNYSGAGLRDGQPVGRRLSTASYDWEGTNSWASMDGNFAVGSQVACTLFVGANAPTNPFRHKYHPDHDNFDTTFSTYKEEAYPVTRQIVLTPTPTDPTQFSNADYGYSVIGGTYRETITGLHRDPLVTSGTFRLTRVANTGTLNQ